MQININFDSLKDPEQKLDTQKEKKKIDVPIKVIPPFQRKPDLVSPPLSKYEIPDILDLSLTSTQQKEKEKEKEVLSIFNATSSESLFSADAKSIPIPNLIPLPKTPKQRDPSLIPFRSYSLPKELRLIHQPEEPKTKLILIFSLISIFFFILIVLRLFTFFSIYASIIFFILAVVGYLAQKRREKVAVPPFPTFSSFSAQNKTTQMSSPSSMFAKPPKQDKNKSDILNQSLNVYRPFVTADRSSATIEKVQFGKSVDYDQLSSETLRKIGITSVAFSKYVTNMKSFVSKTILAKHAKKMHSDDSLIASMLAVPGYEHCNAYVMHRVNSLSSSQFLAGHFGDKGDRWYDREWTTDLPSDNQIVMYILSVWLSFFMSGKRKGRSQMLFNQKYLFIKRDPVLEGEDDILLCSDDWSKFYVYTHYKSGTPEKFYAPPGRDSMYAGLTLLFWFVKEKKRFLMEGADLTDTPICMDRVFSSRNE
ncbi:hypothetical protein TRFO_17113 [Tritrichomonas foetus]|uniref:Uncharacterized protein n=1 Tax=Tritrichomonas foetus TaxID=1144522 RepID=A0A1J4KNP0_9EUKA|nr:hypothetical protein TRFO_17113 [Tritrichomonas foetus]|eukprot:OHT12859.1 hypothetical protein TRFO_17113 [Tritrichomonas foetus]